MMYMASGCCDTGQYPLYTYLSRYPLDNIVMMPIQHVDQGAYRSITNALKVAEFKRVCHECLKR